MTNKKIQLLLFAAIVFGVIVGASTYRLGLGYACPKTSCVDGAMISPVTDGGYYDAAKSIISGAQKTIYIVAFEMKYYESNPDSKQNKIVRELIYAKQRGVDVKVVVDEYSVENNAQDILEANGVEVRKDGKEKTTHAKLIIVDGKKLLIGSTNFSYYGLEKNNEANLLVTDPDSAEYFIEYFQKIWDESG